MTAAERNILAEYAEGRPLLVQNACEHYTPINGPTHCRYKAKMVFCGLQWAEARFDEASR